MDHAQERQGERGRTSDHDTGSFTALDPLASRMADLARDLQHESGADAVLDAIVAGAVDTVRGAEGGSISIVTQRAQVQSRSPSGDLPRQVDALQAETGQGPCLDAAFTHRTVRVPDLATEQRWPVFAQRAARLGVRSVLAFQLFVEGDDLGALNLVSRAPDAFDDESEHVGLLFAAHAAVALAGAQEADGLRRSIGTRDLIGQAKGILMERYKIREDQAFAVLARASQDTNRRLADVAAELATTGEWSRLPGQRMV